MYIKGTFVILSLSLLIKLIAIYLTNFDLFGDEAQYWIWSQSLDFGYYSKPPFVAWIISFFTFSQGWILPNLKDLFLLSMVGVLGGLANLWLTQSYKLSEVTLVTPLKYLALVFAIIFGYIFWDEIPTTKTFIGSILVIISSIIIFRREIYLKKQVSIARHE